MAERGWRALSARDERVVRHLAQCGQCKAHYRELVEMLDSAAADAASDADAVFTAERLAHQRERILRRLDAHGQRARVLSFPASTVTVRGDARSRPALRWVAAAAIAGLMIGLSAGRVLDQRRFFSSSPSPTRLTSVRPATDIAGVGHQASYRPVVSDEEFLSELSDAVAGPRTPELEALDALTLPRQSGPVVPASIKY
jgi:anti-sigma factor RsiW